MFRTLATALATTALVTLAPLSAQAAPDWAKVNQEMGRDGADQPGGVKRFSFPRSDLKVMLDGVEVKAGLALGSWLAFQPTTGNDATVMGDLVLTQDEIGPVMKRLLEGGVEVTAIHNHLLRAEPFPMYMHVEGHGDAIKLAQTLKAAIALSKTPMQAPAPAAAPAAAGFDVEKIATAMGRKGTLDGAIYKYNIARAENIEAHHGVHVGTAHGAGIVINFQDAGGGKVATTGDFVLAETEVAPVMRILRDNGIDVTALHSHMLDEEPRLAFMHFWGVGTPEQVAGSLRKALDKLPTQQAAER
jgi:hypothetical protein